MKQIFECWILLCVSILSGAAFGQTLSGSFSPSSVTTSAPSTLTLNYSGFTQASTGAVFRLYYRAANFSSGPTFTSTVSDFSGATTPAAGTVGSCSGADTYITLNWIKFTGSWPSTSSGELGKVDVTTSTSFAASTNVCITDDSTSPLARPNVASSYALNFFVPPTNATFASSPSTLTFAEGGTAQTVTVTCSGTIGTPSPVVISVASSNTAAFTVAPASLSFTTCPSSQPVTVTPRAADAAFNATQTGNVTFATSTTGATAPASVAVTVTDNQTAAVYSVTKTTASVTENNSTTDTLTVTCTGAFIGPATSGSVQYAISGLTNPGDITSPALTGTLTFATCAGATQSVTVSPRANDAIVQGNKSGTFTISAPVAGTLGSATTGTINVADDDTPQTITVAVTGSPATEAGGVLTYTFTRAGGNTAAVATSLVVNVTPPASSSRYSTTCATTITFAANATTVTCTVTGIDNTVIDGNVNAVATITAPTVAGSYTVGTPSSATGVIADDDTAQIVTVAVAGSPATEAGGVLTYTFTRAGGNAAAVATSLMVNVTPPASSSRYSTTCVASITFAANATTATCTVTGIDNTVVDGNINVAVTIAAPTAAGNYTVGTPSSATGVIADNDFGITVTTANGAITEGQNALFAINCNGASGTFTVNYTIAGRDTGSTATPSATTAQLVCANPTSTVTVTVSTNDDAIIGNNRSVALTLTSVVAATPGPGSVIVGTPASATVNVADNDAPLFVPTMSWLGLGLMGLMLAGLAGFQQRRRTLK